MKNILVYSYERSASFMSTQILNLTSFMINQILNARDNPRVILTFNFQQCSDPKSRPAFLTDKPLEATIKTIVRKFPNFESHLKVRH